MYIHILSFKLVKNGDVGTVNFYSDKRLTFKADFNDYNIETQVRSHDL